jgi:hypothetical protein
MFLADGLLADQRKAAATKNFQGIQVAVIS